MAEKFEITQAMRDVIGVLSPPWAYEVTTTGVRSFARGVGIGNLVFFDEEAARSAGYPNLPAPPTYLGTPVFVPGTSHELYPFAPGNPVEMDFGLPNLLAGGVETVYERPIFAGDILAATTQIVDLDTKVSGSMGVMLLIQMQTEFRDSRGDLVVTEISRSIRY